MAQARLALRVAANPIKKGKGRGSCGWQLALASGMEAGWPQPRSVDGSRQRGAEGARPKHFCPQLNSIGSYVRFHQKRKWFKWPK